MPTFVWYKDVKELEFSLDSIRSTFMNNRSLVQLAEDLISGRTQVERLHVLLIERHNDVWHVMKGNRILYVLQELERLGWLKKKIAVKVFKGRKRFSYVYGQPIKVRGQVDVSRQIQALFQQLR